MNISSLAGFHYRTEISFDYRLVPAYENKKALSPFNHKKYF